MNQDDGKFLLAAIQDMPVFVLYHSIVLIFNNFNWSIWFNNSKKVSFSVSGSVTKSGCSSVFFKVFFIDTPVETYSYSARSGGKTIFHSVFQFNKTSFPS